MFKGTCVLFCDARGQTPFTRAKVEPVENGRRRRTRCRDVARGSSSQPPASCEHPLLLTEPSGGSRGLWLACCSLPAAFASSWKYQK